MTEQEQQRFRSLMGDMPYMAGSRGSTTDWRNVTLNVVDDFLADLITVLDEHAMSDRAETMERDALDHDLRGTAGLLKRLLD